MTQRQTGSMGDELTNAALIGLIGIFCIGLILRAAGTITAFITGTPQPAAGAAGGIAVLLNPADPATALAADGLDPLVYWLVSAGLLGGLTTTAVWVWIVLRRYSRLPARASRGTKVWASVEDSILLIGPPRSGKGLHVVINAILDAPGAVVTTSTRPDNLTATLKARQQGRARSPCSTPSTWPKASPPGCAGHPSGAARPLDGDDPRHRPRRRHRTVRGRGRVRRVLGRQDPHRTPSLLHAAALDGRPRRRAVPLDPRPQRRGRSRRDPQLPPKRRDRAGPTPWRR
jgi:type IV secretion system protein VirD4